jgi:uncharacterized membrane protein YkoI
MNSRTMRWAAGVGGLLATAAFGFGIVQGALAQNQEPARAQGEAAGGAPAMPLEQVLAQLKAEGYAEIYEIEREHGKYEVKAKSKEGRTVELYLDARTGKTLEIDDEGDDD